jgi:Uma2 family endonuclease
MRPSRIGGRIYLNDVDWKTYSRFLRLFAERAGYRLTYDRGLLEITSPSRVLDDEGRLLGTFVRILTEELALPIRAGGSTTLRRRSRRRGVEPDECFWIANAHRLAGARELDLRVHPPPDLAIEIDGSRSRMNRPGIYAALGVPELWQLDGDGMTFHALGADGRYAETPASRSFPLVRPANLIGFVQQARRAADQNTVTHQFRAWARQRAATSPPAPPASNP